MPWQQGLVRSLNLIIAQGPLDGSRHAPIVERFQTASELIHKKITANPSKYPTLSLSLVRCPSFLRCLRIPGGSGGWEIVENPTAEHLLLYRSDMQLLLTHLKSLYLPPKDSSAADLAFRDVARNFCAIRLDDAKRLSGITYDFGYWEGIPTQYPVLEALNDLVTLILPLAFRRDCGGALLIGTCEHCGDHFIKARTNEAYCAVRCRDAQGLIMAARSS